MTIPTTALSFSTQEVETFQRDGYIIVHGLIPPDTINTMKRITQRDLAANQGDIEYEADLSYPGAPESLDAEGGRTARRLRHTKL